MRAWLGIAAVVVGLAACGNDERPVTEKRAREVEVAPDPAPPPALPSPRPPPRDTQLIDVNRTHVHLNGQLIGDVGEGLTERVTAALAVARLDPATPATRVTIVADKDTPYQLLVLVMDGAKTAGYTDIVFSIQP